MASLTVKQFDTYPALVATLSDSSGPINLTTATNVTLVMVGNKLSTKITGTCTIVSATAGEVSYTWAATDLNVVDTYQLEFVIHWSTGVVQKVPNSYAANPTVEVDADLTGAAE